MMKRDFTRDSDPVTYLVIFVVKTFGRVSFGFEIEARDEECGAGINGPVTLSSARAGGCHPQTKTGNSRMIFYLRRDLGPVIMGGDNIILTMEYYIAITEARADRCHRDRAQESHHGSEDFVYIHDFLPGLKWVRAVR